MRNGFALVCIIKQAQSQKQAEIKRKNYMEKKYMDNQMNLKPCPFCGGEAIRLIDFDDEYERLYLESIHCRSCHARVAWQETVEEAAEAWNRRAEK